MKRRQNRPGGSRTDPRSNRAEAYRLIAAEHPDAETSEIIRLVRERYGHTLTPKFVYLAKAKEKRKGADDPTLAAMRAARTMLRVAGSLERAIQYLRAAAE